MIDGLGGATGPALGGFLLLLASLAVARTWGSRDPQVVLAIGGTMAVLGWALFWLVPPTHGRLPAPFLQLIAGALPMVMVPSRRRRPLLAFASTALGFLLAGCALGTPLLAPLGTPALQETLLGLGLVAPPTVGIAVAFAQRRPAASTACLRVPR